MNHQNQPTIMSPAIFCLFRRAFGLFLLILGYVLVFAQEASEQEIVLVDANQTIFVSEGTYVHGLPENVKTKPQETPKIKRHNSVKTKSIKKKEKLVKIKKEKPSPVSISKYVPVDNHTALLSSNGFKTVVTNNSSSQKILLAVLMKSQILGGFKRAFFKISNKKHEFKSKYYSKSNLIRPPPLILYKI